MHLHKGLLKLTRAEIRKRISAMPVTTSQIKVMRGVIKRLQQENDRLTGMSVIAVDSCVDHP